MAEREINQRQILFCENYVENGGNAAKAYRDAGYKEYKSNRNEAIKLLQKPCIIEHIRALVAKRQAGKAEKDAVTVEWIQQKCRELHADCIRAKDRATAATALRLLGQTIAAYTDNLQTGDIQKKKEIDIELKDEAKRIAKILNKQDEQGGAIRLTG